MRLVIKLNLSENWGSNC